MISIGPGRISSSLATRSTPDRSGVLSNHDEVDRYVTGPSLHRLTHAAETSPVWLAHLLTSATGAIDGSKSALVPRIVVVSSLAMHVRDMFSKT